MTATPFLRLHPNIQHAAERSHSRARRITNWPAETPDAVTLSKLLILSAKAACRWEVSDRIGHSRPLLRLLIWGDEFIFALQAVPLFLLLLFIITLFILIIRPCCNTAANNEGRRPRYYNTLYSIVRMENRKCSQSNDTLPWTNYFKFLNFHSFDIMMSSAISLKLIITPKNILMTPLLTKVHRKGLLIGTLVK